MFTDETLTETAEMTAGICFHCGELIAWEYDDDDRGGKWYWCNCDGGQARRTREHADEYDDYE